jgi:hypothetical protein
MVAEELAAGGMIGITAMLKEISKSTENLKVIDHGDLKILLEHGPHIILALNVKEDMMIYRDKLAQLCESIEKLFSNIFESWDGNMKYFEPIKPLVESIFVKESH